MEAVLALVLAASTPAAAAPSDRPHYCVREAAVRRVDRPWTGPAPERGRGAGTVRPLADLPPASLHRAVYCRSDPPAAVPVKRPPKGSH